MHAALPLAVGPAIWTGGGPPSSTSGWRWPSLRAARRCQASGSMHLPRITGSLDICAMPGAAVYRMARARGGEDEWWPRASWTDASPHHQRGQRLNALRSPQPLHSPLHLTPPAGAPTIIAPIFPPLPERPCAVARCNTSTWPCLPQHRASQRRVWYTRCLRTWTL